MSMCTTFPSTIVKSHTTFGSSAHRPHDAGGTVDQCGARRERAARERPRDGGRPADLLRRAHLHGGGVGDEHHVGVEQRDQGVELTVARRGEEGIDDLSLTGGVGVGNRACSLDAAASSAGELARRIR